MSDGLGRLHYTLIKLAKHHVGTAQCEKTRELSAGVWGIVLAIGIMV